MSNAIDQFHPLLNSRDLVEARWYERNHKAYELVCYVNIIAGLYLSRNYETIPAFLDRVHGYLARDDKAQVSDAYRQIVEAYIRAVAQFLEASLEVSTDAKALIPRDLLLAP